MLIIWSETRRGGALVIGIFGGERLGDDERDLEAAKKALVSKFGHGLPLSWTFDLKVSIKALPLDAPIKYESASPSKRLGDCCTSKVSSCGASCSLEGFFSSVFDGEASLGVVLVAGDLEWILDKISIFSSFSSSKSFNSLTSCSNDRTLSSKDSV